MLGPISPHGADGSSVETSLSALRSSGLPRMTPRAYEGLPAVLTCRPRTVFPRPSRPFLAETLLLTMSKAHSWSGPLKHAPPLREISPRPRRAAPQLHQNHFLAKARTPPYPIGLLSHYQLFTCRRDRVVLPLVLWTIARWFHLQRPVSTRKL